jgi:hypothetical protein
MAELPPDAIEELELDPAVARRAWLDHVESLLGRKLSEHERRLGNAVGSTFICKQKDQHLTRRVIWIGDTFNNPEVRVCISYEDKSGEKVGDNAFVPLNWLIRCFRNPKLGYEWRTTEELDPKKSFYNRNKRTTK